MKKKIISALFLVMAIVPMATTAQEKTKKSVFKKKVTLGSSWYSGNIERFDFRFGGDMSHSDSLNEFNFNLNFIYSETDLKVKNREYNGSVKWDYMHMSRFSPFMMISGYNNYFKGIGLRSSGLLGAKYRIWHAPGTDYSISAALQGDLERFAVQGWRESAFKFDKKILRLSVRPKIKQKLGQFTLDHVTFYQPALKDFSDYRILSKTALSIKVTSRTQLGLSYDYEVQSKPPISGIKKEDHLVMANITINF